MDSEERLPKGERDAGVHPGTSTSLSSVVEKFDCGNDANGDENGFELFSAAATSLRVPSHAGSLKQIGG